MLAYCLQDEFKDDWTLFALLVSGGEMTLWVEMNHEERVKTESGRRQSKNGTN